MIKPYYETEEYSEEENELKKKIELLSGENQKIKYEINKIKFQNQNKFEKEIVTCLNFSSSSSSSSKEKYAV